MKDTQILGTVGYAAPEQFGFSQTTYKADIYAVGTLINYMAEGVLPNEHLTDGTFRKIIIKCTQMDEKNRYDSIEELAAVIDKKAKRELLLKKVPGFGGSTGTKTAFAIYYTAVLLNSFIYLLMPGKRFMTVLMPAFYILPLIIIFDTNKRIYHFCVKHNLSKGKRILIKATLIWLVLSIISLIIIAVFI